MGRMTVGSRVFEATHSAEIIFEYFELVSERIVFVSMSFYSKLA